MIADPLLSLAHPSVSVLQKQPNKKELRRDDKFRINPAFDSKLKKLVVPQLRGISGAASVRAVQTQIEIGRRQLVDASVVC